MTTTITIPSIKKITATVETTTSEYGSPRPILTLRVLGEAHHKEVQAVTHTFAAQVELALLARRCEAVVNTDSGCGYAYDGKTRIGSQSRISLELVGDERRMPLLAELAIASAALAEVADRINAAAK